MAGLKLFLLGPPRVELNDGLIDIQRRRALAMLVYLAISGQAHSRDALATLFWPDLDQQRARAYLRRDLAALNTSLPGNWLIVDRETVELNRKAGLWLDTEQFQRLLAACQEHGHAPEVICTECISLLTKAVKLYSGDFLAGFTLRDSPEFDDWQFFQSESLRRELATALERLVQGLSGQEEPEAAIPYARRWVALDSLHEPAQRQLIRVYDRAGQPAAALRQYEEYVKLLDEELGLPPEEETTTLYEAIKAKRIFAPFLKAKEQRSKKGAERKKVEEQKSPGGLTEALAPRTPSASVVGPSLSGADLALTKRGSPSSITEPPSMAQQIHLCRSPDGVHIAYAALGQGPLIVKAGNPLTHLIYDRQSPVWRHWWEGLAQHHTLVRYDERGCGLSDWNVPNFSMNAWVQDLETVVNQFDSERFALLGVSQGVSVAIAYAVRHPERVSHLILYGGYVRGRFHRDPSPEHQEEAQTMINLIRFGWGKDHAAFRQVITTLLIPEGTPEQINWFNDLARITASPENAAAMEAAFYNISVIDLAPKVTVPTLILHARDDAMCSFQEGQLIAALIPGARFVPLESKNHILLEHEPAWHQFLAEVHQFLGVKPEKQPVPSPKRQTVSPSILPPPLPQTPLFVARQAELTQLDTFLEAALTGQNRIIFVIGEAGQGKSALLQAFSRRAQAAHPDLLCANGTCNLYTGIGDPYLPFREILEQLTGAVEAHVTAGTVSGEQAERLRHFLPHSVQLLVQAGADLLDTFIPAKPLLSRATAYAPNGATWLDELQALINSKLGQANGHKLQQVALFEQYTKVVQALSHQTPLLLLLDDLQWADTGSTNLLFHLGRRLAGHRVLIVGAYRPTDIAIGRDGKRHPLEFVVNEFQRRFGDISLNLAQSEGETFVNALLDSEANQLDGSFRAALFQLTEGHPLFTIELLRGMQERGDLVRDEVGRWVEQPGLDWQKLPARVEAAIGERISRLAQPLRELLRVASIEGEEFTAEVVAQVLNAEPYQVLSQLSRELDKAHRLVRPLGVRREGTLRLSRYRFQHILIQRYLYNSLDEVERVHQHEAVGLALERLYSEQAATIAAQLARHFETADLPQKARLYLYEAGEQARRSAALHEAIQYYQAALEKWPDQDKAGRAQMLRQLGECQWITGHLEDALNTFEASFDLFESLQDKQGAGASQRLIGRVYWELGNRERSLQHYQRALTILEAAPESVELAWAVSSISQMSMLASDYDEAIHWGERALDLAERLSAPDVTVHALNNMGTSYMHMGQADRGERLLEESARQALELGLPHDTCRAYLVLGESLSELDRYAEATTTLEKLLAYAERVHVPLFAGSALVELVKLDWLRGNWRAALKRRQKISEWLDQGQSMSYVLVIAHNLFGQMHNDLGQPDAASQALAHISTQVAARDELQTTGPYLAQVARAYALLGHEEEADAIIRTFLNTLDQASYVHWGIGAHAILSQIWWLGRRATPQADEAAKTLIKYMERSRTQSGSSPQFEAGSHEGQGVILLYKGTYAEAVEHFQKAADGWLSLGRPYDQLRALHGLAQALIHTNDTAQARTAVDQGLEIIETLASELDDTTTKATFLNSPLVQQLRQVGSAVGIPAIVAQTAASNESPRPASERISPHKLPTQATPFIGREKEVRELKHLLGVESSSRLITVVGPGGIGKTRLALEAAARASADFSHGSYFVSLAPLNSAEHLVSTIAEGVNFHFYEGGEPKQQLLDYLHKKQILLLIDNFEHLLTGAALVLEILQYAPQVKILITSRERLNLSGETIYLLSGMNVPDRDAAEDALDFDAVKLLIQQARLVWPNFEPGRDDLAEITYICRLTHGMPLALVLAAGWLEALSFKEIATEIVQSLDFLETETRDMPERQRSVRATFDYSWKRLLPAEQESFTRLSVFRGGFTRRAAQAVADVDLRSLHTLLNKSFVSMSREDHYQIHELLRQFGEEQLERLGEADRICHRHSQYYLDLVHQRETDLKGRRQEAALDEIEADFENIRAAWHWALQQNNEVSINLALEGLYLFFYLCSRFLEGTQFFRLARERLAPAATKAPSAVLGRILTRYALMQSHLSDPGDEHKADILKGQAIAQKHQDQAELALCFLTFGYFTAYVVRDAAGAMKFFEQSLKLYQALNDHYYTAQALIWLAYCHGHTTGLDNFFQFLKQSLALARAGGDKVHERYALSNLAAGMFCAGDYMTAEHYVEEALRITGETKRYQDIAHLQIQLSLAHLLRGDIAQASWLGTEGLAIAQDIRYSTTTAYGLALLGLLAGLNGNYPRARQLGEESIATPSTTFGLILGHWSLAVANCGLERDPVAWQHVQETVNLARTAAYPGMLTWPLPVAAIIRARQNQPQRAVEWLGLASHHPLSPIGWTAQWTLLADLRAELETELGPELFQAAWQRGETLDLETWVAKLLMGFEGQAKAKAKTMSESAPLLPAAAIGQRFIQESLLAIGGMGQVYLGRDSKTGQRVAIKRLKPELVAHHPEAVQRLIREGEILRQLNHPNIVKVLATLENEEEPMIVMEYIPGGSLKDLLDRQPQLPLERALLIGLELADALARVHHLDILHRDLKPANILLAADGAPRLTDFGVAYLAQKDSKLTQEGAILGTTAYLSPEAWRGEPLDARSDIWSFGAVLYEMLAGRPPFAAEQAMASMTAILNDPLPNLFQFRPDAPPALVELIKHMLVKERELRLDSMRQVAAGLEVIRRYI